MIDWVGRYVCVSICVCLYVKLVCVCVNVHMRFYVCRAGSWAHISSWYVYTCVGVHKCRVCICKYCMCVCLSIYVCVCLYMFVCVNG